MFVSSLLLVPLLYYLDRAGGIQPHTPKEKVDGDHEGQQDKAASEPADIGNITPVRGTNVYDVSHLGD